MSDAGKAVFLSYASQDAEAAKRICDALRAAGVEVWFDQSELVGGDAWDVKIRKQIKECALFVPIISAATQARPEGYFRLEWRLADQRTHLMGRNKAFLLPVCVDATPDANADVPDSFTTVQWTRLKEDAALPAFAARVGKLLAGDVAGVADPGLAVGADLRRVGGAPARLKPAPTAKYLWLVPAIAGAIAMAGVATWVVLKPGATAKPQSLDSKPVALSPGATELARVRARIIPDRWQKGDFEAIAPALDRIIAANPDEADAWALRSIINSLQVLRILDPGTQPLETGKTAAEHALRLAPESPLGQLALGMHLVANVSRGGDPRACRDPIDRAVAMLAPDTLTRYAELVSFWLGYDFENTERVAAAWLKADPQANYPAWIMTSLSIATRRTEEVEKWAERSFRDQELTSVRALCNLADAQFFLRADLVACRATLERIPVRARSVARVVHWRWLLPMAEGRWDDALQELAQVPDAMLHDVIYNGPKALLVGLAHQQAGRADAANSQFHEAERLLREKLAADPDNEALRAVLAVTLASAGRADEARRELTLVEPLVRGRAPNVYRPRLVVSLAQAYGALGDFKTMAFWLRKLFAEPSNTPLTPASFRLDPRFNGAVNAPEIQALLKEFASLDQPPAGAATRKADEKSVAVLPFANLSSDKEQEYFSDGLSENILDKLARIPGLRVMARTSSFSYKGRSVPVQQIARELRVGTLIEGSVQRAGSRLRITAQLINATDGTHVWSETYDRDLTAADIFAIQDEIALKIAARLQPGAVTAAAAAAPQPTQNLAAYEAYLRGRSIEAKGFSQVRLLAVPYYEEAVRLDPGFTLAWARLAYALAWIHWGNSIIVGDELDRAQQALAAAVRLQPDLPEVHLARGAILKADGVNLAEADRELALAESRQPANPDIIYERALVARFSGRLEEALALSRRAAERDPYNSNTSNTAGIILRMLGRYPEALAAFEESARLSSGALHNFNPNFNRAITILRAEGDAAKALREFDGLPREQVDANFRTYIAGVQNAAGLHAEALAGIKAIDQPTFLSQWAFQVRALLAARTREMMGDAAGAQRDYTEAWPLAVAYRDQHPRSWRAYSAVALASAALGKKDEALAAARTALKLVPPAENPFYASQATLPVLVEVYARFGMMDEALAIVREQIATGWWRRNDLLLLQDYFFIRQDPRFRALAEKAPL